MKTKQPKASKRKKAGQPRGLSVTAGSAKWLGHNEPNSRGLMQDLGQSVATGAQYTLTADEALIVYQALARFHDLEDYGYARDWEGITAYCPHAEGGSWGQGPVPEVEIRTDGTSLPNAKISNGSAKNKD